jgi:hypothetical protein
LRFGSGGYWGGCGGFRTVNANQTTGSAICGELLSVLHNGELSGHLFLNAESGVRLRCNGENSLLGLGINLQRFGRNAVGETEQLNFGFPFKL